MPISKRAQAGGDADFDFRGISWLGRDRDISTSVSPRSFAQLRSAPPSAGRKEYLGLGENTPPSASARRLVPAAADRDCILPLSSWAHPISAQGAAGRRSDHLASFDPERRPDRHRRQFTDTGLEARTDLDQYRIIHFATHGVVTARAAKCAAQPALLTSFGGDGSDGLLTFREIFDLHLDADLVILSACDTAGKASAAATQQAGLATGGDVALDGLVRAFVGAGGRLVIASHWPVPDDINATQRLITGLFSAPPGTPTVTALRLSQRAADGRRRTRRTPSTGRRSRPSATAKSRSSARKQQHRAGASNGLLVGLTADLVGLRIAAAAGRHARSARRLAGAGRLIARSAPARATCSADARTTGVGAAGRLRGACGCGLGRLGRRQRPPSSAIRRCNDHQPGVHDRLHRERARNSPIMVSNCFRVNG